MFNPSHILTGTDFTRHSKGPVREALRMVAADPSRRLTLVHVASQIDDARATKDKIMAWASELPEFKDLQSSDQVIPDLEIGRVPVGLARSAQRMGASLIVVGPRLRGFLEKWITGGIAEQLLHKTQVPLLATKGPATGGYKAILVPVDFSPMSRTAIETASSLLRTPGVGAEGGTLYLQHVASRPPSSSKETRASLEASIKNNASARLKKLSVSTGIEDLTREYRVTFGVVQSAVPRLAEEVDADLICTASKRIGGVLGSTADAILRNVEQPMLVVWSDEG